MQERLQSPEAFYLSPASPTIFLEMNPNEIELGDGSLAKVVGAF